jgi:hypothetical protein
MAQIKISQLPAKAANVAATDLLEVSEVSGLTYVSKKITGAELVGNRVPYTGATTNVDLGEYELKAGQLTLDVLPTGTAAVGTTRWNNTLGSSETTLKGGSVILKNGVDLVARIVNKVTPNTTLTKATYPVVKVSGAQGQRLAVAYAQANNDNNSADTLGLVIETIPTNQEGFIMTVGQIENINTTGSLQGETWADGDVLYLSPTIPGAITKVKPTGATGHIVIIGYVEYAHVNNGKIYVKIMNGWELDELHNVYINPATLANNDALIYESSTQLWKNKTIATALGYTPENVSNKSTNTSLGTSDTLYPTQNAVKTYADNILGNANALVYKGVIDCSANPNYPAADAGWMYIVSVAGKIGGASGIDVEVGDMLICNTDGTVSGNQATVGSYWNAIQKNIVGAVTGPASSTNNNVAFFDGTTGKIIKDSGITLSGTNTGDQTLSGLGGVPTSRNLTINGTTQDLSVDRTWNVGTVTSVGATGPITSSGGVSPTISTSMATNKLIGRSTAGTGVMEEISVGTGLTLSGGTLSAAPNVQSVTSSATVTPTSANDLVVITAQAAALTLAAPTGSPVQGQALMIRIKDDGTARGITWTSGAGGYRAIGVTLPTTTVISKTTYVGLIYNSTDSRWDAIGVTTEV